MIENGILSGAVCTDLNATSNKLGGNIYDATEVGWHTADNCPVIKVWLEKDAILDIVPELQKLSSVNDVSCDL